MPEGRSTRLVWVVQSGEPIVTDGREARAMRGMHLVDALLAEGHRPVLVTASYDHHRKVHRTRYAKRVFLPSGLQIVYLQSPGYRRNVGIARLIDHAVLGVSARRVLSRATPPDVAFVGFPPIELAVAVSNVLSRRGIAFVLDVKDQWPEELVRPLPPLLRTVGRALLAPYFRAARSVMRTANTVSSISTSFLAWVGEFSGRVLTDGDFVAPLTNGRSRATGRVDVAEQSLEPLHVVFLTSNISSASYDLRGVRLACEWLAESRPQIQIVVAGLVPTPQFVRSQFGEAPNVVFTGLVGQSGIEEMLASALCTVAPYARTDAFERSVPNKVVESLLHGVPVVSPLGGEVGGLLENRECGLRYDPSEPDGLARLLQQLASDGALVSRLREGARLAADREFDHVENYRRVVGRLMQLTAHSVRHAHDDERAVGSP